MFPWSVINSRHDELLKVSKSVVKKHEVFFVKPSNTKDKWCLLNQMTAKYIVQTEDHFEFWYKVSSLV